MNICAKKENVPHSFIYFFTENSNFFWVYEGLCQQHITPPLPLFPCQDIKNADLALYELNRVITLEPNWPEVYEQRAEVRTAVVRNSLQLTAPLDII